MDEIKYGKDELDIKIEKAKTKMKKKEEGSKGLFKDLPGRLKQRASAALRVVAGQSKRLANSLYLLLL